MTASVIVTDDGFRTEDFEGAFAPYDGTRPAGAPGLDIAPDADLAALDGGFDGLEVIRIAFPSFADGRGFTLARRLRAMGYTGRLRAAGHVLSDQYAMARRSGFDEVEISVELAARQPEAHWLARADWRALDYRARLAG